MPKKPLAKVKKLKPGATQKPGELPKIIADEYADTKKEVASFTFISDLMVIRVLDKKLPNWSAIDVWRINSYSKNWSQRGRITTTFANSHET
jgi:hypothetical protein